MLLDLVKIVDKNNLDIRGVLHIGAHFGEENSIYNQLGIEHKIFFEPLLKNYQELIKNVTDGTCVNMALGNQEGEVEMFVESANQGQSSSILEPDIHLKQYPHITFDSKNLVKITKLDTFITENNIKLHDFNFINIDVQGYELEVFKGSITTLEHIDYILTEVNRSSVYKNCCLIDELDAFLSTYNFTRIETNWAGNTWGDAFYIKK